MLVKIERAERGEPSRDDDVAVEIKAALKRALLVTPAVQVVDYGELPRSERKTRRVFDKRDPSISIQTLDSAAKRKSDVLN